MVLLTPDADEADLGELKETDFPHRYTSFAHPEDFKIQPQPIQREHIYHRTPNHLRLLLRVSLKLSQNEFAPMTFVIDTGAALTLWLGYPARKLLSDKGILGRNASGELALKLNGTSITVGKTPRGHLPANILGLPLLFHWKLRLSTNPNSFTFDEPFDFLEVAGMEDSEPLDDQDIADPR
eukprot:EG_transcript_30144